MAASKSTINKKHETLRILTKTECVDHVNKKPVTSRVVTKIAKCADNVNKKRETSRVVSKTEKCVDGINKKRETSRVVSKTAKCVDGVNKKRETSRVVSKTAKCVDGVNKKRETSRVVSKTAKCVDGVNKKRETSRVVSKTAKCVDGVNKKRETSRVASKTAKCVDGVNKKRKASRIITKDTKRVVDGNSQTVTVAKKEGTVDEIECKKRKATERDNAFTAPKKRKIAEQIEGRKRNPVSVKTTKLQNKIKWTIGGETVDEAVPPHTFPPKGNSSKNMSAAEYFELFFDDTIVELIMLASSEYCLSLNLPDIKLTKPELRAFFGILILSGYNTLPGKPMYWSCDKDLGNEAVAQTMRRDRFDQIMRSLHFLSNTNLDQSDKFAKLRPLISHLQKKFMQNFIPTDEAISHDEAMVEYFGNHGCKQAIRDKPIRFGYKIFCQNTPSGYLIAFNPYQGKTFQADEEMEEQFGKSSSSLLHILDSYPLSKSEYPYHFYCDNYFTSIPMLSELKNRGYNCTGTIRADRVGKDCPLMDVKKFKKQRRGYSEVATAHHLNNKIFLNRWRDNSAVTVASTCYASNPETTVKRWCKNERKRIDVPIPHAIHKYNRNMGGTDRTDQNINNYRISIRGKKWWWSMFTWMLDASVQNGWILARQANPKLTQLRFRRNLVKSYFNAHNNPRKEVGRKQHVSDAFRLDRIDHFPRKTSNNKQRRCAGTNCKSTIRQECSKCNVGLCIACFITYHTVA